jgi:nucleoside-diphosphate-sugar epimerase
LKTLVVTGATGYIGRYVVAGAVARGWNVIAATRRKPSASNVGWIRYALRDALKADQFPLGATVLHLATEMAADRDVQTGLEVEAARRLLAVVRDRGLQIMFASSQAARANAPTAYGRVKWQIEEEVLANGGCVIRPGLVYGGVPGGLFARLLTLVRRVPVLPALVPPARVQPIHVADLAEGVLRIAESDDRLHGSYNLAAESPIPFTTFLRTMASERVRRYRTFVPVPIGVVQVGLRLTHWLSGHGFEPNRLRSLTELPVLDTAQHLASIGLELRPLASGMHASGSDRRYRLLAEGRALLWYLLRRRPQASLLARYVRVIEGVRDGRPARLPRFAWRYPRFIALLDSRELLTGARAFELDWRLDAATTLAESTPAGAKRFLLLGNGLSAPAAALRMGGAIVGEACWRTLRWSLAPLLRRAVMTTDEHG